MHWNAGALIESATCAALHYGSAALSIVIVYQAGTARAGTSETAPLVVAAIGVLAAVFSMTAVPKARRAWRDGDRAIAALFIGGLLVSEPYLVSYEIAWWEQNVSAAQARQKAKQVASADRDEAITRAQETLRALKGARDRGEVQADIDKEMARTVSLGRGVRETLAKATADCTDKTVPAYAQCVAILTLRAELATIEKLEKARFVVGTRVQDAEITVPTNAGEARIARITGVNVDAIEDIFLIIGIAVLAFLRLTSGALGSDKAGTDASEPALASGRGGSRIGSATPAASLPVPDLDALRLDTGEMPAREGGEAAQSHALRDACGDAARNASAPDGEGPGSVLPALIEPPAGDLPARNEATTLQGTPAAGVSPGSQGMPRRSIAAATDAPEGDSVSRFYRERCAPSLGSRISAQSLYAAYRAWCKPRGLAPESMTRFGRNLPGYARRLKTGGRVVYLDMAVPDAPQPASPATTPTMRPIVPMPAHPGASHDSFRTTSASADAFAGANAGVG